MPHRKLLKKIEEKGITFDPKNGRALAYPELIVEYYQNRATALLGKAETEEWLYEVLVCAYFFEYAKKDLIQEELKGLITWLNEHIPEDSEQKILQIETVFDQFFDYYSWMEDMNGAKQDMEPTGSVFNNEVLAHRYLEFCDMRRLEFVHGGHCLRLHDYEKFLGSKLGETLVNQAEFWSINISEWMYDNFDMLNGIEALIRSEWETRCSMIQATEAQEFPPVLTGLNEIAQDRLLTPELYGINA